MTPERLRSMPRWAVAFDVETFLTQPGLLAPPLVCASTAILGDNGKIETKIWGKEDALGVFLELLEDDRYIIVGAHIVYDMLVCAVEWARRGRDVLPLIFKAYAAGRVFDVLITEALNAIANGELGEDPRTGGDLRDPITREPTKYYSLAIVTDLRLDRKDAKANDEWRKKYFYLDGIPIEQWPPAARDYPQDDARNTLEDALAQCGHLPSAGRHSWNPEGHCRHCGCGVEGAEATCFAIRPARNIHAAAEQAYTAWALHLGAAWGFNVDQAAVAKEVGRVTKIREAAAPRLIELGFLKWKKDKGVLKLSESKSKVARAVAEAYGAKAPCFTCGGIGRVPKDKIPTRVAYNPEKHGKGCLECCGTGYDLSFVPDMPRTEPSDTYPYGQVKCDADTLNETNDDRLIFLADYKEDQKTVTNYGPYLEKAKRRLPDGSWVSVPLTLWPNVLLETDRTSYADAIQQFPRDGALRECVVARPGWVLCSCDYNQGEVITHAQSCLSILGHSRQAEIVLEGKEPHSMFGSSVLGVPYDLFFKDKKKNKTYANARQAAKPFIFGRPGRMGAVKLVQTQRKQGPDTPCAHGPIQIEIDGPDGTKIKTAGYRGLRFCILMDGAETCGSLKVTRWGRGDYERSISPTCRACLECAERLLRQYHDNFPEAKPYFEFCNMVVEDGQPLTDEQCAVHGMPIGSQLAPGEMCQHVSWIIRGKLGGNECCNGYFQSLLAVASKRAMRIAQRECCDSTIVVPADACFGGVVSQFAGQRSPLFGSRCIVLQHDEIIAEFPEHIAHEAAIRLSEIMVRCFQEVCPDMAPACKAPPCLMRAWYKAAEPVYMPSGKGEPTLPQDRLVPWAPKPKKEVASGSHS